MGFEYDGKCIILKDSLQEVETGEEVPVGIVYTEKEP